MAEKVQLSLWYHDKKVCARVQSLPEMSRQTPITYTSEQSRSSHDAFRCDKMGQGATIIQTAITVTQQL